MSREKTHQEWAEFERNEQLALADFFAGENVQRFSPLSGKFYNLPHESFDRDLVLSSVVSGRTLFFRLNPDNEQTLHPFELIPVGAVSSENGESEVMDSD